MKVFTTVILLTFVFQFSLAQIQFQGLNTANEGAAAWNADGTGPEPLGDGHGSFLYYVATTDYVNAASVSGAKVLSVGSDFPLFAQALTDNGFSPGQVSLKMGLASLGDDLEGMDWFTIGSEDYLNFYPLALTFLLNGEPMISGEANYLMFQYGVSTAYQWFVESNFFQTVDASGGSSTAVQSVAAAFLQDMEGQELRLVLQTFGSSINFSNNGRFGAIFSFTGNVSKDLPQLAIQGLAVNHEGFAGWDANGTGPEPKRNGHSNQLFYIASRDYDDIDPDPNACFARFLSEGSKGFQNFALQLEYRGFDPEQLKIKMGLRDLGEDIQGEDWNIVGSIHQVNFYQSNIVIELNGEPLFGFVCDTAKTNQNLSNPGMGWWGTTAKTCVYDASANSSTEVQAVAMSFFKDLEQRKICTETVQMTAAPGNFNSNGRTGNFFQINDAKLVASIGPGTNIQSGNVSGNWTRSGHPYIVAGNINVPDGQTLTIDPGVWIKFNDRINFNVEGCLIAAGDTSNTGGIVFTAVNPELGWGHIIFDGTSASNETSVFENCIFEWGYAPQPEPYNSPYNCGGALAIRDYDKVHVGNCIFQNNRALIDGFWHATGGAIALWNSNPVINNSVFKNNSANCSGAITVYESSPTISNSLFYSNKSQMSSSYGAGAMLIFSNSNPVLINNTFCGNISSYWGGALEIGSNSHPELINNIFWNNDAQSYSQICISTGGCNFDIIHNDIENGESGIGPFGFGTGVYENNIEEDPLFADILALDFGLTLLSPCVDGGTPDTTELNMQPTDILGNWRIWDGNGDEIAIVDMGAFEFDSPPYITGIETPERENGNILLSNYPNPSSSKTTIEYELQDAGFVSVSIFNHLGQQIEILVNEDQLPGIHQIVWNVETVPAGIYFCKIITTNYRAIGKMVVER